MNVAYRKFKYRLRPAQPKKRRYCNGRMRAAGSFKRFISLIVCLGILALGSALFVKTERRMSGVINEVAISKLNDIMTTQANEAVQTVLKENDITYSELINTTTNSGGGITGITTDFSQINKLKTDLALEFQNRINGLDHIDIKVPIGAFFSDTLASGFGINIPVRVITTESIYVDFSDSFDSVGINQSKHSLMVSISADMDLISAAGRTDASMKTEFPMADTIIVGEVPNTYMEIKD